MKFIRFSTLKTSCFDWIVRILFTIVCIGITCRQGYNTAIKYAGTPMTTQDEEISLQG